MAVNNVNIQAFNCEINDENRRHIEDKMDNLERLWPKVDEAQIRVTEVRGRYVTEITLISGGLITRGALRSIPRSIALSSSCAATKSANSRAAIAAKPTARATLR